MSRRIVSAILLFSVLALMVPLSAPAATLFLRNGEDDSDSLTLDPGDTGLLEIAMELEEGETLAFATVFLDGIIVEGQSDVVEIVDFIAGFIDFNYDRSAMPAGFPYAEGEGITIDEYSLNMGQGSISGPGIIVLETLVVHSLGEGTINISFETGAREPVIYGPGPTFTVLKPAPTSLPPGIPGFVYLGKGDAREGGVGPFVLGHGTPANDNVEPPENDNETPPPTNDNVPTTDNENENTSANDNTVVEPDEPSVEVNDNESNDLLGVLDDGLTELAVFVDRDENNDPVTIIGLVIESDGALAKMDIGGNLLRNIEGENNQTIELTYDFDGNTVTLTSSSGDMVVVTLPEEVDLSAAAGTGAGPIPGELPEDSMIRLLDELSSVMRTIMETIGADADAVALLDEVGGYELVSYPFDVAADSVEMAVDGDQVDPTDFNDLGESTIDDPLDDLAGLTEDPTEEAAGSGTDGGGGGGGGQRTPALCGFGMLSFAAPTLLGLTLIRSRRRR